jgi:Domain of unknown function (DUF4272)
MGNIMNNNKPMRSAEEAAKRLLILASVCAVANESELRLEIVDWLKEESLWEALSPNEIRFLETKHPAEKDEIKYSWYVEAIYLIGWALMLEKTLLPPINQASSGNILDQIPAPSESTTDFIANAKLRSQDEVYSQAEELYNAHSRCRAAEMQNRHERHGHNIEVAQERHYAINWLICYEGADWDDVVTDT